MPTLTRDDFFDVVEAVCKAQLRALRRFRRSAKLKTHGGRRSSMDMVEDILKREGQPVHITALLAAIQKRFGVELDRESVVSAISKRIARHDRFLRTAPNTFALIPAREDSE